MYKESKYNLYIPYEDYTILFNTFTRKFLILNTIDTDSFQKNIIVSKNIQPLISSGFVVSKTTNETQAFIKKRNEAINHARYSLMILSTYDCNFRCWYCVQDHKPLYLNADMVTRIKAHLKSYLTENHIKELELIWFGGEPMMNFDALVDICTFAKQLCDSHNIYFFNSITTNGYFLDAQKVDVIKGYNFTSFQITIDGRKSDHNRVKRCINNENQSSFDVTLHNLVNILQNIPKARISLRFNYTQDNIYPKEIVDDINAIIPSPLRGRIMFNFQKVWQVQQFSKNDKLQELSEMMIKSGYLPFSVENSCPYACYVELKHYNSIMPNGNVVKCSNCELHNQEGIIESNGMLRWYQNKDYSLPQQCTKCPLLPYCCGDCPEKRKDLPSNMNECFTQHKEDAYKSILMYCFDFLSLSKSNSE